MNKYKVKFLTAPLEKDLAIYEISNYAEWYPGLTIEDMGLAIVKVEVQAVDMVTAVREAYRKMFNSWKGFTFEEIGVERG